MEIWRSVPNTCGCYKISNLGNLYSFRGGAAHVKKQRKPSMTPQGYLVIDILIYEQRHTKKVHRLVAEAFLPNPNNYRVVNHIDGNKLNNTLSNLEWCDHSHNNQHAWDTGLNTKKYGADNRLACLTQEQADQIRQMKKDGIKRKAIREHFGVSESTVDQIVSGRRYVK